MEGETVSRKAEERKQSNENNRVRRIMKPERRGKTGKSKTGREALKSTGASEANKIESHGRATMTRRVRKGIRGRAE
jgi:hypothetical protein